MKQQAGWHCRFRGQGPDAALRSWLAEPGSLTARCQRAAGVFRVRLLYYGRGWPLAETLPVRAHGSVREVMLECDGRPVIFAHTTLSGERGGRLSRWMGRLGNRSLGSLLFAYPGFQRSAIEFLRLDRRHPLYRRAARVVALPPMVWARRSRHTLDGQEILVTELFLPGILGLAESRRSV